MKYWSSFLFLVSLSIGSLAQNPQSDSIQSLLRSSTDDKKIEILQQLVISLWLNHPDSAMYYAHEALHIASNLNNTRYLAIANRLMGGVHSYKGNYDSSLQYNKKAYALSLEVNDARLIN